MTNKKIKETQNHIASLEKQLNSLNQDALKRLDFLSQQDGILSIRWTNETINSENN